MRRVPILMLGMLGLWCASAPCRAQGPFLLELNGRLTSSYSILSAVATNDGGFAISGGADDAAFLLKLDGSGGITWYRTYDAYGTPGLVQARDGGFILAGERFSYDDYVLIKTDDLGAVQWARVYDDGSRNQGLYSVKEDVDGSIVASGIFTMKADSTGLQQWMRIHIGGGGNVNCVALSGDGGTVATGEGSYGSPSDGYNLVVTKLDATGRVLFNRNFGGIDYDWGASIISTADGGFAVAGWTRSFSASNNSDAFLLKLDATGAMSWARVYDAGQTNDSAYAVQEVPGGGYILSGALADQLSLIRTDDTGQLLWAHSYGPGTGYAVVLAPGGGFMTAGRGGSSGVVVVRTDDMGLVGNCLLATPPAVGADAPFLSGTNSTDSPASWPTADLVVGPGGPPPSVRDSCVPPPTDIDTDGIGDGADNCLNIPNPGQEDVDVDGVGDACDNCVTVSNASQVDADRDLLGDACDCAPLDASNAPPPAIADLRVTLVGHLAWTRPPEADRSDVHSGTIAALWTDPGTAGAACLASDVPTSQLDDARPLVPALPRAGFYYLVAARNGCGWTMATDSLGGPRPITPCP